MTLSNLGPYPLEPGYEEATSLDEADPLRGARERFIETESSLIYLDGNSLGRLPIEAEATVEDVTRRQWGDRLIRSWNEGWWDLQIRLGDKLAPLVGAGAGEVMISDSTSVNLYKLAMAALTLSGPERRHIVTDDLNFPSDVYILDSVAKANDGELRVVRSDGVSGPVDGLHQALDEETALLSLSHTAYTSGYTYDVAALSASARQAGALTLWDCSHSVGVVPISLAGWGVDLAVGCTYKYLSGGPGSPAFLYVRQDLQNQLHNPITGWWAHEQPFDFRLDFEPTSGIRRFHAGTMPVISLAAVEAGVDLIRDIGIDPIRRKSLDLTDFLIHMWRETLEPLGFSLASPTVPERRGSHLAFRHEMAWPITRAMIEEALVIPDFRAPDNLRLGLSPLYTSFTDVHTAVHRIKSLIDDGLHLAYVGEQATVT